MKSVIEVEITSIEVDDKYYSFQYRVIIDGVDKDISEYSSDHTWGDDKKTFEEILKNGEAVKLALEQALQ